MKNHPDKESGIREMKQDDFFIIGPSYEKCAPAIAYRNKLKRCKSSSPRRAPKNLTKSPELMRRSLKQKSTEEFIQTDDYKQSLTEEIKKIRETLEQQKQLKNEPQKLKLSLPKTKAEKGVYTDEHVQVMPQQQKKINAKVLEKDEAVEPKRVKHTRSLSPTVAKRLTEYRSAYRPAGEEYLRQHAKYPSRKLDKTEIAPKSTIHNVYETEYQHEYRPFKYVSENEFRTTNIELDPTTNLVLIPRAKTVFKADKAHKTTLSKRTQTTDKRVARKKMPERKLISEYGAQYRGYMTELSPVVAEFKQNRRKQQEMQSRGSHFCREHLAQLDSEFVNYWDAPSPESYEVNCRRNAKFLRIGAAGIPSVGCDGDVDGVDRTHRDHNRYDSTNIYRIMEYDEESSNSSSSDGTIGRYEHSAEIDCHKTKNLTRNRHFPERIADKSTSIAQINDFTHATAKALRFSDENESDMDETITSPLSMQSMKTSARIASKTLQRARERMHSNYPRNDQTYSPLRYCG